MGSGGTAYKELSIVVFLSQPGIDFLGGHFEVELDGISHRLPAKKGSAVVFHARKVRHRVTPVTKGTRRTLVGWATTRDVSATCEVCVDFGVALTH